MRIWLRDRRTAARDGSTPLRDLAAGANHLVTWSDEDLVLAWKVSDARLRRVQLFNPWSESVPRIAARCRSFAEELERRHPEGLEDWLTGPDDGPLTLWDRSRRPPDDGA